MRDRQKCQPRGKATRPRHGTNRVVGQATIHRGFRCIRKRDQGDSTDWGSGENQILKPKPAPLASIARTFSPTIRGPSAERESHVPARKIQTAGLCCGLQQASLGGLESGAD